jgi:hypothetical protein
MTDFLSIVHASGEGGVTIDIDHPQGAMQWHLPGDRADELVDAIRARQGRVVFDRPPQEDYVRASVVRGPFSFEVAIEHRKGDDFEALTEMLEGLALTAATNEHANAMEAARAFGANARFVWGDRAWFVEAWKEGARGFAQIFQPFGIPRNR